MIFQIVHIRAQDDLDPAAVCLVRGFFVGNDGYRYIRAGDTCGWIY